MGGYGSGRKGGRRTVESGPTLNLSRLFELEWLKPGAATRSVLRWTDFRTGKESASMEFEARLGEKDGYIALQWTTTHLLTGERRQCEAHIQLTTTPQPFGGRRWWFVCPRNGSRVTCLYLPCGEYAFASRSAYWLAYRSQRETAYGRAFSRVFALRHRLGDKGPIGGYIAKPKGMHWRTFGRVMDRIVDAEAVAGLFVEKELDRLTKRAKVDSRVF